LSSLERFVSMKQRSCCWEEMTCIGRLGKIVGVRDLSSSGSYFMGILFNTRVGISPPWEQGH
jgi:hypothetical protein